MTYDRDRLIQDLIRDEDIRQFAYDDATGKPVKPDSHIFGKITIGIGRNLVDLGLSRNEAIYLANNDISRLESELDRAWPYWRELSAGRQRAMLNMAFNLGISGLLKFRDMLTAMERGDFEAAAREAYDSHWAQQVGDGPGGKDDRADRIVKLIREG